MNKQESDILLSLYEEPFISQRVLSKVVGYSEYAVNHAINLLIADGYLDDLCRLTPLANMRIQRSAPHRAIILAAGFGMRMVPINKEIPKALLEVNGERLVERLIKQLHETGIYEIYVVVGFMKEAFEYLIDAYGVKLIVNENYAVKNNLSSAALVADKLENAYIVPCDVWCDRNLFREHEMNSWYMVSDLVDDYSAVRINRKMELVRIEKKNGGNAMIGISYLTAEDAPSIRNRIINMAQKAEYDGMFWEEALYDDWKMCIPGRVVSSADAVEINTYEQLRELDSHSNQLKSKAIDIICQSIHCKPSEVTDIIILKKGMTNRSFLFSCQGKRYIMRIPGEGTDMIINRQQEAAVYG